MLEKYFNYKKHKTDFKTEVTAGVTTFLTMAYIMFLNPFILSGEFAGQKKVSLILGQYLQQQLLQQRLLASSWHSMEKPGFINIIQLTSLYLCNI